MSSDYFWYKEHHICVECHAEEATRNSTRCSQCLANRRERDRKQKQILRQSPEYRERQKQYNKERRARLKEAGICTICGKRKARFNKTTCIECATKASKSKKQNLGFQLRSTLGICYKCNNPAVKSYKLCENHLKLARQFMKTARECKNA